MARRISNWITEYLDHTQHSEAPESFHFWTAVSVLAGAVRRKVWLNMGYFKWTPNFYIFFIAPPGIVSKSTTGRIGMDLLRELDYINFGPSSCTWQSLIKRMSEIGEEFPIAEDTFMPMSAITITISELGTFLDPSNREQIDVLVDLWDGMEGVWEKETKTVSSEAIPNPWINMLGFTTPAWIAENFSDYFAGGGFMSRSIFVYAEEKRKLVAYPSEHLPDGFMAQKQELVHDLDEIGRMTGAFVLTPEAKAWGETWYAEHYSQLKKGEVSERFQGSFARKQTHIHKLAMILSLAKRDDLIITEKELSQANDEITKLEKDMPKMFGQMNREKEVVIAAEVLSYLRKQGTMKQTQLYNHFIKTITYDTFEKVIRSLQNGGLTKFEVIEGHHYVVPISKKGNNNV